MKKAPYSLAEAEKLCEEYSSLVGSPFVRDGNAVIECVTMVPFDEIGRKRFLIYYFLFNNAQSVLAHEYKGLLYDIIVIARSVEDEHELLHEDLYTWLKDNSGEVNDNSDVSEVVRTSISQG
jgi:hypothetical protein